ncbi:MAG TPA: outer membrane beta-barrel protein [Candidatus Brocadiales bacterium]|nr:outer membrane beta-barrel protein [Candidatus Brocadiales bacterium]
MIKRVLSLVFILTAFLFCLETETNAQNIQGRLGIGVRGGFSVLSQDLAADTEGKIGPIISGNITYGLTNIFSVGLNVEWEKHKVNDKPTGFNFGDENTISVLPFAEIRSTGLGGNRNLLPYAFFGLGININSFSESSDVAPVEIEPENTLALKIGVGADYFVTPNLALNAEAGYKLNSGDVDFKIGGFTLGTDDNEISTFSLLFGLRYYL